MEPTTAESTTHRPHSPGHQAFSRLPSLLVIAALLVPMSAACASRATVRISHPAPRAAAVVKVKHPPAAPRHKVVVVRKAPPKPKREVVVVKPKGHQVWVAGHWHWAAGSYVWKSGKWTQPPQRTAVWVKPRYEKRRAGWVYTPGYWR